MQMNDNQRSCSGRLGEFLTAMGVAGLCVFGLLANFGNVKRGAPAFSASLFLHGLIALVIVIVLLLICEDSKKSIRSVMVMSFFGAWTFSGGLAVLFLEERMAPLNHSASNYSPMYWHLASAWPYLFLFGLIIWLVMNGPRNLDEL